MRVLVACEFSQIVTRAFRERGHEAFSCDILPTEGNPEWHIQDDIANHLKRKPHNWWDMMIAFPPCTHLCVSGARWFKDKINEQDKALEFVYMLMEADIDRICIENPVGVISTRIRRPDQIIQPYHFGDPFQKTTCIWLKNLPRLIPTHYDAPLFDKKVDKGEFMVTRSGKRFAAWYNIGPGPNRQKIRSKTFPGIAAAMADQWGKIERREGRE